MSKKYLISYKYQACFQYHDRVSRNAETDTIAIIEEHPAQFVANAKQLEYAARDKLTGHNMVERFDVILAIYSVTEIPEGTLTEEEEDILS